MDLDYDSKKLIGKVKEVHKNLERKGWDWRSFYNGWIEGRANMLVELREGNTDNLESGKCNKHIVIKSCENCKNRRQCQYMPFPTEKDVEKCPFFEHVL